MTFQNSGERRARSSAPRGTAALSKRAADHSAFTLHAEGGGVEPHAGEDAHSFRARSGAIASSPSRCCCCGGRRSRAPHRRVPTGFKPAPVPHRFTLHVQGGSRTRMPVAGHRGLSAACLPVPTTWTSKCPGRESNSHARRRAPASETGVSPVVPPPGRCSARGEGRTRMGREARWPLEPVCLPGVPPPERSCGGRTRTDGLRGMSPAICQLIYPAVMTTTSEGIEPPTSRTGRVRSCSTELRGQSVDSVPGGTRTPDLLVRNQAL